MQFGLLRGVGLNYLLSYICPLQYYYSISTQSILQLLITTSTTHNHKHNIGIIPTLLILQKSVYIQQMVLQTLKLRNKKSSMFSNGYRAYSNQKQLYSPARNGTSRSSHSINNRPFINFNGSPRMMPAAGNKEQSFYNMGEKMRLMKSKIGNISIQSRNGINQNNLYPTELIFLLSNEESNVDHMRKLIQTQKRRIQRDFDNFTKQISHMIQDLKLSLHSQLDFVFKDFINLYASLKDQVVRLRENRKRILQNRPIQQYEAKPTYRGPIMSNNANNNNVSNLNLLQQISKDEDYFKNHKVYQQITNAYFQAIGPIMDNAQNILSIGSQMQFYKDEKCNQILNGIRTNFFSNTKIIFQNELDNLVTQVKQIVEDNNMLLKDLNIEQTRNDRNEHSNYITQKQKPASISSYNNIQSTIRNGANKNRRAETQTNNEGSNPYGFEPPNFKNNMQAENQRRGKGLRPSSSSEYIKYMSRPESNRRKQLQAEREKYTINTNMVNYTSKKLLKVAKDQQNAIVEYAESVKFSKNTSIYAAQAQDILLCLIFIANGKYIAVGSKDKNIYIYSADNGKIVQTLMGHQASICCLANFKGFFASGGDNRCNSLILWENFVSQTYQWKMKRKVNLHSAALTCIVDLLDGTHLATGGYDKKIHIYNYRQSSNVFQTITCKAGVTSMVVCQLSRKLVSAGLDSTLTIWNIFTKNGEIDKINSQRTVTYCGLVCSLRPLILSQNTVLVGNKDGKIMMLNVYTGQQVKTLAVGQGSVIQMNAIQRKNKSQLPLILSCCSAERQMILTRPESGNCEFTKAKISIGFGCGISPKAVFHESGIIAIVNQNSQQKQVSLYSMQIS